MNSGSAPYSTGSQPYCVTFSYGSEYLSFVCSEKDGVEYDMEPYWSGFSDPIAFPVYTGSNGISIGTQYPAGYPTPSSTSSDSNSKSGSTSSTSQANSESSTSDADSSNNRHSSSTPVGAIVGGVIGGLALIGTIAGVIVFFAVIQPRQRERLTQTQHLQLGPQGPPPYPTPPNPTMKTIPPNAAVQHFAPQGPPQWAPAPQVSSYELLAQHHTPELDSSGQQHAYGKHGENVYKAP